MTIMTKPRAFRLKNKDGDDDVEFTGVQLSLATTETPEATRWTEISIYRTEGGRYVIHRCGRSVLFHAHAGTCNTGVPIMIGQLDEFDRNELQPCARCRPGEIVDIELREMIDREVDWYNVDDCPAAEVAETLKLKRDDGTKFISQVAQRALLEAMNVDAVLRDSVTVRKIS